MGVLPTADCSGVENGSDAILDTLLVISFLLHTVGAPVHVKPTKT